MDRHTGRDGYPREEPANIVVVNIVERPRNARAGDSLARGGAPTFGPQPEASANSESWEFD